MSYIRKLHRRGRLVPFDLKIIIAFQDVSFLAAINLGCFMLEVMAKFVEHSFVFLHSTAMRFIHIIK